MTNTRSLELEGTWEEISTHASELVGKRVRLIVLPVEPESPDGIAHQPPANSLLRYTEERAGDGLLERLLDVYGNSDKPEF